MIHNIVSKDNKIVKLVKSLRKKNTRTELGKYTAEGVKIVREAISYVPERIDSVIVSESFSEQNNELVGEAESVCGRVYIVMDKIFGDISDTDTPQGIMAIMDICGGEPCIDGEKCDIVVLDCVSEPGNLGTVIRTAEALGFDGIYLMKGCADIYSPKAVRSTMGSLFRMKFKTDCIIDDVEGLRNEGFCIISTTPNCEDALEKFRPKKKQAVIIGNEAHGVCAELLEKSDYKVKITMKGMAESLNAAVAAGIAMHWLKNISAEEFFSV